MTETPVLTALVEMAGRLRVPLHVPGHKQGRVLPTELSQWLGAATKLDLTELPGLDNLFQPSGCIAESQRLAARHYGSEQCLYSVNGSTAGVIASILAAARGGNVLFAGPFHQSAWRGLVLADAQPVFLPVGWDAKRWSPRPPKAADVRQQLRSRRVSAVYVTSPTYTGAVAPIQEIAAAAHAAGVPLIVDEAHGAHFGLAPGLPPHSVAAGADIVVQSTHKMLPALTQTAWIHRQGCRVRDRDLEQALRMIQSTSPSYLLLASLDAAQAWLRREGRQAAESVVRMVAPLHEGAASDYPTDPFRHWIPTGDLRVSRELQQRLAESGMYVEYADAMGVLSLFGFGIRERDVERYLSVVRETLADTVVGTDEAGVWQRAAESALSPRLVASPRDVFMAETEPIALTQAQGRISASLVTPYPPGVPVVFPGQSLDKPTLAVLAQMSRIGADIHGLLPAGRIAVLREGTMA